jgi:hypothetical protein
MRPKTNYTKIGEFNIAYQEIGQGLIDILYIPGWVSNIDMMWTEPRLAAFLTRLSLFSRLIIFDKRGFRIGKTMFKRVINTAKNGMHICCH